MDASLIIKELVRGKAVFDSLLKETDYETAVWKPTDDQWSLLEVVCHLYDEEREDFRARVRVCLETPELPFAPIDPVGWVESRKYIEQDFDKKLADFLSEREDSIKWLKSLEQPNWKSTVEHPQTRRIVCETFFIKLASTRPHSHTPDKSCKISISEPTHRKFS